MRHAIHIHIAQHEGSTSKNQTKQNQKQHHPYIEILWGPTKMKIKITHQKTYKTMEVQGVPQPNTSEPK